MVTKSSIGVGLISVGWMGRLHSRAYLATKQFFPELPQHPELIIAADPDESGRVHADQSLGYRETTSDYHEVLNHPDVDVVSICSPNFLHHEIGLATIAAGKNFWIEKPMGISAQQSREIAEFRQNLIIFLPGVFLKKMKATNKINFDNFLPNSQTNFQFYWQSTKAIFQKKIFYFF